MSQLIATCVYGVPHPDLVQVPVGAVQTSPLHPGAEALEGLAAASVERFIVCAPPGVVERAYVLALALTALKPGGELIAMAPKDKGGARLGKELVGFGCEVEETGRRHQRLCRTRRPDTVTGADKAIEAGRPQRVEGLGLISQPGLFSWNRIDPGTAQLLSVLPPLSGRGADLGCGTGILARAVLAHAAVQQLDLVDIDQRAIEVARLNIDDQRVKLHWADARSAPALSELDFVVMNPPFHDGGREDRALGQAFVRRAHEILRKGGSLWLVANRHLPYEAILTPLFHAVSLKIETGGFKVYEARK